MANPKWLLLSWTSGLLTIHLITTSFINHLVPEAYMVGFYNDRLMHPKMTGSFNAIL
jgi:hypothetical protein